VTSSLTRKGLSAAAASALGLATGAWVALIDPGDTLSPEALLRLVEPMQDEELDLVYSDEDRLDATGRRVEPYFKPAWSPHLLLSQPYAARLAAVRRELLNRVGGLRPGFDGAHDYDLVLRIAEASGRIRHVPHVLYHRLASEPACSRGPARESALAALDQARVRRGILGTVKPGPCSGVFRVVREAADWPRVTIAVPTRDRADLLRACLDGILNRTDYPDLEVLVVDHDSTDAGTLRYLSSATADPRVRVVPYTGRFNFAAMNNTAARAGRGEFVLFLNNDTETLGSGWLKAMVGLALDPSVGAVGARLLYPEGAVQHAGVVLGVGGVASHAFGGMPASSDLYFGSLHSDRNYAAVTAACLLTRRAEFLASGGFDAGELPGAYADLDYCLRLRRAGKLVVYCGEAELLHHEGASRRGAEDRACKETFERRWRPELAADGYYSPHLNRARADFSIRV
jgi:GT2 family glycosyltransferase